MLLESPAALCDDAQGGGVVGRIHGAEQRPTRGELPDPRTADHVVTEIAERVEHALGGQRNVRIMVHAQEEDAHTHRYITLVVEREERIVSGKGVPTRQGVELVGRVRVRTSRNNKTTHIDIGGYTNACRISHRVERP